jgi:hypothetical protein
LRLITPLEFEKAPTAMLALLEPLESADRPQATLSKLPDASPPAPSSPSAALSQTNWASAGKEATHIAANTVIVLTSAPLKRLAADNLPKKCPMAWHQQ